MKTNVWKKIDDRVRIVEDDKEMFLVQSRDKKTFSKGFTEWRTLNQFSMFKHALKKKHSYIVMILMRELGYRNFFVEKRVQRKKRLGLI